MSLLARPVILIVEDEPFIRLAAADAFEAAGFAVVETADAASAIEILQAQPDVALLFTDIDMPGSMNGIALANFVRERWPPVQILVASGMTQIDTSELPTGARFFAKPYRAQTVIQAATALLQ